LAEETLPILGINTEVLLKFVEHQLRKQVKASAVIAVKWFTARGAWDWSSRMIASETLMRAEVLQHRVYVYPFLLFLRPVRYVIYLNTVSMQPDKAIFLSF